MQTDRFAPPRSNVRANIHARKPRPVWLMQCVATLLGIYIIGGIIRLSISFDLAVVGWTGLAARYIISVAVLVWIASVVIGSELLKAWARWLGLALIALLFAAGCLLCSLILMESGGQVPLRLVDAQDALIGGTLMVVAVGTFTACCLSAATRAWYRALDRQ